MLRWQVVKRGVRLHKNGRVERIPRGMKDWDPSCLCGIGFGCTD